MLKYEEDTQMLSMIAKDTGDLLVSLENYDITDETVLYFTVNNELEKKNPLISKEITEFVENKALIHLSKEDSDLSPGNYLYDIQIDTGEDRVDTVIGPAKFKILGGVKY